MFVDSELSFRRPPGYVGDTYPPLAVPVKRNQRIFFDCCATGYQSITWYVCRMDGSPILVPQSPRYLDLYHSCVLLDPIYVSIQI